MDDDKSQGGGKEKPADASLRPPARLIEEAC